MKFQRWTVSATHVACSICHFFLMQTAHHVPSTAAQVWSAHGSITTAQQCEVRFSMPDMRSGTENQKRRLALLQAWYTVTHWKLKYNFHAQRVDHNLLEWSMQCDVMYISEQWEPFRSNREAQRDVVQCNGVIRVGPVGGWHVCTSTVLMSCTNHKMAVADPLPHGKPLNGWAARGVPVGLWGRLYSLTSCTLDSFQLPGG